MDRLGVTCHRRGGGITWWGAVSQALASLRVAVGAGSVLVSWVEGAADAFSGATPRTPSAGNLVSGPHVVVDPDAGQLDVVVELPVVEASRGRCALLERHPPAQGAVGSLSLGVAAPRAGPQRV